ncbi:MATE family efflux transporter [Paratractidigestivibacter sp.]|uniref:MATE family efflux transporter n=1 Tax=Paratractidigestivibacter sp. TaxID=2847316 RepID=UPI002AC917F0|nr:MATE family efflux transporter [Paratractidigestivibacter sp.]
MARASETSTSSERLLSEEPLAAIVGFAVPMALSSLLEQLYNMVDSIVAGNFLGETAVAAVGASFSLCNVLVYAAIGCGIGAGVLAARRYGEGSRAGAARVIWTSVALFSAVGLVLAVAGLPLADLVLEALGTPAEALADSVAYMAVYFFGLPALFSLNATSAMFNAVGDSRTPLALLAVSAFINVAGDVASTAFLGMGVAGIAVSTVAAEYVVAVLGALILWNRTRRWSDGKSMLDKSLVFPIERLAVPSVLQQSTIAIGLMLVQSVVNGFGASYLAGFSAAMRVENVATVPTIALGSALSSFASQNVGAGQDERADEGYRVSQRLVAVTAITIFAVYQLFCEQIIAAFLGSDATPAAMQVGVDYMRFVGWCYALIGLKNVADGMLRGLGDTRIFTWANIINLGLRVGLAHLLAPSLGVAVTWWVVPLGWFVNFAISHAGVVAWRKNLRQAANGA